ncbi:MAG: leucine-rich repeat protein [Treponema sp.]|nr:leucine-rich repeat protein [Treponema sp.]
MGKKIHKFTMISILIFSFNFFFGCSGSITGTESTEKNTQTEQTEKEKKDSEQQATITEPDVYYTITFLPNNEAVSGETAGIKGKAHSIITLPSNGYILEGYIFTGWNTAADGSGKGYANGDSLSLTSDITLYAQWILATIPTYSINTSVTQNGTIAVNKNIAEAGTEITLTLIPDEFYALDSFSIKSVDGSTITPTQTYFADVYTFIMPEQNVAVSATFKYIHSITVDTDYPANYPGDVQYFSENETIGGSEISVRITIPKWYQLDIFSIVDSEDNQISSTSTQSGRQIYYNFIMPESDVKIFVKISRVKHTITFETNCSAEVASQTVEHGSKLTKPVINVPECSGNLTWYYITHVGQTYNTGYYKEIDIDTWEVYGDMTFYAKWECFNATRENFEEVYNYSKNYPCTLKLSGSFEESTISSLQLAKDSKLDLSDVTGLTTVTLKNSSIRELIFPTQNINRVCIEDLNNLIELNIPNGVTSLKVNNCKGLTSIDIPDTVKNIDSFKGCSSLKTITLPNSLETIGDYAFYNCTSLTNISFPDSLETIGDEAFYNCASLKTITLPNSLETIGDEAFYNCTSLTNISFPNSLETIGDYAFCNCTSLTNILFPDSLESIGKYAFCSCSNLLTISFPEALVSIGDHPFYNCSLLELTVPKCITTLRKDFFSGISNLKKLIIPDTVVSIEKGALSQCVSLEELTIPFVGASANATEASESTLFGWIFGDEDNGCEAVKQITTEEYGTEDFYGAYVKIFYIPTTLTKVNIHGGKLYYGAFSSCSNNSMFSSSHNYTTIILPENIETIPDSAFYNCTVQTIKIPKKVSEIGEYAFYSQVNDGFGGCKSGSLISNILFEDTNSDWSRPYASIYYSANSIKLIEQL